MQQTCDIDHHSKLNSDTKADAKAGKYLILFRVETNCEINRKSKR